MTRLPSAARDVPLLRPAVEVLRRPFVVVAGDVVGREARIDVSVLRDDEVVAVAHVGPAESRLLGPSLVLAGFATAYGGLAIAGIDTGELEAALGLFEEWPAWAPPLRTLVFIVSLGLPLALLVVGVCRLARFASPTTFRVGATPGVDLPHAEAPDDWALVVWNRDGPVLRLPEGARGRAWTGAGVRELGELRPVVDLLHDARAVRLEWLGYVFEVAAAGAPVRLGSGWRTRLRRVAWWPLLASLAVHGGALELLRSLPHNPNHWGLDVRVCGPPRVAADGVGPRRLRHAPGEPAPSAAASRDLWEAPFVELCVEEALLRRPWLTSIPEPRLAARHGEIVVTLDGRFDPGLTACVYGAMDWW